jgi:hypothetical protein
MIDDFIDYFAYFPSFSFIKRVNIYTKSLFILVYLRFLFYVLLKVYIKFIVKFIYKEKKVYRKLKSNIRQSNFLKAI